MTCIDSDPSVPVTFSPQTLPTLTFHPDTSDILAGERTRSTEHLKFPVLLPVGLL